MYSERITARQIEKAERDLSAKEPGFKVQRLTVGEVVALNQELYALSDPDRREFVKPLSQRLRRAIFSERLLCRWDFTYYQSRYHHIMSWQSEKWVRMEPNIAQRIMLGVMAEAEEKRLAIDIQSLKARQLGITTLSEAAIAHRVLFHPNSRAAVGSANPEKSAKMVGMVEEAYDRIPFWISPERTTHKKAEYMEFKKHGSWLSVYHGAMKTGFARGQTPTIAHLSEVTEWLDPDADIDTALMFAMHKGPRRILILESTAGYIGDWFNQQWDWNKARWGVEGQVARLRPMFLPWFVGRDLYPTKTEEREHPVPKGWTPAELTKKHAESARIYVQSDSILRGALGAGWRMPREQMYWWEYTREYYKQKGKLNDFLRECPSNDVECFSSKYSTVFDAEIIINLQAQAKPPEAMYVMDARDLRDELKPDTRNIDTNLKPIHIDKEYTLYPLRMSLWSPMMNPDGIIFVWEMPKDGCVYGLGVDSSKGIGQDASVVETMRKATASAVARQVAEFASLWVSSNDVAPWVHCIARMFQVREKSAWESPGNDSLLLQPKMSIEVNNGGDACQLALQKMGWRNFHNWIRVDKKIIDEGKANFLGVLMTEHFRDKVFGHLVKAIKDGLIDVDSPWFLSEMSTLEKDEEKRRIDHAPNKHDDRFVALGLILVSLHELDWEGLKSTFGKGRIMQEVSVLGAEKERSYPKQPSISPIAKIANEEGKAIADLLWNARSDVWEGYQQRFAPKWGTRD